MRSAYGFELWTHDIWTSHLDEACALVYWAAFAWTLSPRRASSALEPRARIGVLMPFACVLVLYFAMPFRLGATTMLNVRLAPLLALFAIPFLNPASGPRGDGPLGLAFCAALAVPAVSAFEILRVVREEIGDPSALFAQMRPGSRLVELSFRVESPRMHFPPWPHVGAYHRARGGGVAEPSFT